MPALGRLRYLEAAARGRAQGTLLLIHGFPLNAHMWDDQMPLAEQGWRIVAPHLRGFENGAADPPAETMDDFAGDVIDLLDGLHITEAVIGGLSMGGYVTFAILRHAPQYFRGLLLADTRPQADTTDGAAGRARMIALAREKGATAIADDMLPKLLGETTRRERPDIVERTRNLVLSNSSEAIAGALTAMKARPDSTPLLSTIRCPTLIIAGDEDSITPPELSEGMQHAIPGAEYVLIPRAGHMSNMEHPQEFNAALARFLSRRV